MKASFLVYFVLAAAFPDKDTVESMVYYLHLQIWSTPAAACYEELAGGFEPKRNGEIF